MADDLGCGVQIASALTVPATIPDFVVRFLERDIDSVSHLETLLLMWETAPAAWSERDVSSRVYVSLSTARAILADLARRKLIISSGTDQTHFAVNLAWKDLSASGLDATALLLEVSRWHRERLVQITEIIHSKAPNALRDFAGAFDMRKKDH